MMTTENMKCRFKSKVDGWLFVLLLFLPFQSIGVLIYLYAQNNPYSWSGWIGILIVVGIYGGLLFPLYYELEEDALLIRFGLVRSRVAYNEITLVEPTRCLLSSPALSLDRIYIQSKSDFGAVISPKDQELFLEELLKRTDHLQRIDGSLRPRT